MKTLTGFSKGLYSNWFYHKPTRTLFDCGEGVATYFGNFMYGIERLCIGHGHGDHVLGIPSLVGCRNSGRGDKTKPLDIYYPFNNDNIKDLIDFISKRNKYLDYEVRWIPVYSDSEIKINKTTFIKTFTMCHQRNHRLSLGYNIIERRTRLKFEYAGKNIPELLSKGIKIEDIQEEYQKRILSYCLDAYSINPDDIRDTSLAIMDCTFLNYEDRDDPTHFTLEESVRVCEQANAKRMLAAHFSGRYHHNQIVDKINQIRKKSFVNRELKHKPSVEIDFVLPGEIYQND